VRKQPARSRQKPSTTNNCVDTGNGRHTYTLAASSGKRNVTVWRPSVCPRLSVPSLFLTLLERAAHTQRHSSGTAACGAASVHFGPTTTCLIGVLFHPSVLELLDVCSSSPKTLGTNDAGILGAGYSRCRQTNSVKANLNSNNERFHACVSVETQWSQWTVWAA